MSDPKFHKQIGQSVPETMECKGESKTKKDLSSLLAAFGGFSVVKSFIPEAEDMNPTSKASYNIFLNDRRFKEKRVSLARELECWIALLGSGQTTPSGFVDECKRLEEDYQQLLNDNPDDNDIKVQYEREEQALKEFYNHLSTND